MITADEIRRLFQHQLEKIKDEKLREQVVQVWVTAAALGGWRSIEDLQRLPFTILTDTKGISIIEHTIAVTEGALGLAEAQLRAYPQMPYPVNFDRLIAGGLLHDVGKLVEVQPDGKGGYKKSRAGELARHPISGAIIAAKVGLSDDVINTIACHAKEGEGAPKVLETVLIHQADFATFDPLVMMQKGQLIL
ncbi:MAG: HD domain-containing protein [candidate division WOR-3 bacterium]|uniref:HD domain-containing protein n=1 Tax=candidate division WOR-3 bacterium TaxID=2052148 RepID=A0A7C2B301_UNCW3|nr:HD domain-containing protein [candidate division WOR-3 bacterium]